MRVREANGIAFNLERRNCY